MIKRPLLAAKATDQQLRALRYPMLASPKIDGIRAIVSDSQLLSRTMKKIPNKYTQALFGRPELNGLDGELVVGQPYDKGLMQATQSGVSSIMGTPMVRYHVFDVWNSAASFQTRLELLVQDRLDQIDLIKIPVIRVPHSIVYDYDSMLELEAEYLLEGYEGLMLRSLTGKYKQGRSTINEQILVKVKRFHDAEAEVIGYDPLLRNHNEETLDERGYTKRSSHQANKVADDLLGSLTVRCLETGQVFNIGSGFTEAQRRAAWDERTKLVGRIVKYKSFRVTGVKEKPRFPIFLGFRSKFDL